MNIKKVGQGPQRQC